MMVVVIMMVTAMMTTATMFNVDHVVGDDDYDDKGGDGDYDGE